MKRALKWILIILPATWVLGYVMMMYEDHDFQERKQEHISSIRLKLDQHDYSGAESLAKKYLRQKDPDVQKLYEEAKQKKEAQARLEEIDRNLKIISSSEDYKVILKAYKELSNLDPENSNYKEKQEAYSTLREEQLLTELKAIPASQYSENLSKYNELKSIRPESEKYQKKSVYYADKIKEQDRQAKERAKAVQQGRFSAERLVQSSLKNPDSYEHVNTKYLITDKEIVFIVTYRGTNSFNAVVPGKSVVKTDLDGLGARIASSN